MNHLPPSVVDSEDSLLFDGSTAPTTPEGSLSFSPVLRPARNVDSLVEDVIALNPRQSNSRSLSSALLDGSIHPRPIRNICCVGAGYVGGPTASVVAFQNPHIKVTVVDKDATRIRRWMSRHPPIYEPGLAEIVRVARDGSREFAFSCEAFKSDVSEEDASSTSSSECGSQCGCHPDVVTTVSARQPNLFFSTEVGKCIGEADVVLIAVNTPTKSRGRGAGHATDMTAFEAVTREVALHARPGAIIVEKSTVPCRTANLVQETMAVHRPGVHFEILSNPEFLAAGTAMNDLLYPDRVLIGCAMTPSGRRAAESVAAVYAAWVPRHRIVTTNVFSSELAKLVANSMLAQRISSINSIAAICEQTGADVDEVAAAIGCDPRIGDKFLKAGIGFGGSCFRKDVLSLVYLAESLGLPEVAEYWEQVVRMNEHARNRFAARVVRHLNNTLAGKKLAVLGYAFKKNTNDTRESPALEIIRSLLEEGPREIAIFDPCCSPDVVRDELQRFLGGSGSEKMSLLREDGGPLQVYASAYEACLSSTAVLITTDFDEFKNTRQAAAPTPATTTRSAASPKDPRPFERLEPTESDLLSLHRYLVQTATPATTDAEASEDPLGRFLVQPPCIEGCPDCRLESSSAYVATQEYRPKERLDWAKIAYHMQEPKWVFDGRGVIDIKEMTKIGVRVETVGRQRRF